MARTYNPITGKYSDEPIFEGSFIPDDPTGKFTKHLWNPKTQKMDISQSFFEPSSPIPAMEQYMWTKDALGIPPQPPYAPYTPMSSDQKTPNMSVGEATSPLNEEPQSSPFLPENIRKAVADAKKQQEEESKQLDIMDLDDKELANAREARNKMQLLAGLTEAGGTIGTALATGGEKTLAQMQPNFLKTLREQADQQVSDVLTKRKELDNLIARQEAFSTLATTKKKADPKSDISSFYRSLAKQLIPNVPENASAAEIEKALPYISQMASMREASEIKKAAAEERAELKQTQMRNKLHQDVAFKVDPGDSRSGTTKRMSDQLNRIRSIEAFMYGEDPNKFTPEQVNEIYRSLDAVVSGGVGSITGYTEVNPSTMKKSLTKLQQYITGKPTAAKMGPFIKQVQRTLNAETQALNAGIKESVFRKMYSMKPAFERVGGIDDFYTILQVRTKIPLELIKTMESDPNFLGSYIPEYDPGHPRYKYQEEQFKEPSFDASDIKTPDTLKALSEERLEAQRDALNTLKKNKEVKKEDKFGFIPD